MAGIENVVDNRVFEIDPRDPSTPSLKKGNASELDSGERKQAIARKTQWFRPGQGDLCSRAIRPWIRLWVTMVRAGLQQRISHCRTPPGRVRMRCVSRWGSRNSGLVHARFWSVSMEAQVHTTSRRTVQRGRAGPGGATGIKQGHSGREGNWRVAYEREWKDYATKLQARWTRRNLTAADATLSACRTFRSGVCRRPCEDAGFALARQLRGSVLAAAPSSSAA